MSARFTQLPLVLIGTAPTPNIHNSISIWPILKHLYYSVVVHIPAKTCEKYGDLVGGVRSRLKTPSSCAPRTKHSHCSFSVARRAVYCGEHNFMRETYSTLT